MQISSIWSPLAAPIDVFIVNSILVYWMLIGFTSTLTTAKQQKKWCGACLCVSFPTWLVTRRFLFIFSIFFFLFFFVFTSSEMAFPLFAHFYDSPNKITIQHTGNDHQTAASRRESSPAEARLYSHFLIGYPLKDLSHVSLITLVLCWYKEGATLYPGVSVPCSFLDISTRWM